MSALNKENLPLPLSIVIGTQAATASVPALCLNKRYEIKSIKLMNGATLAADNTNFLQVSLQTLAGVEIAELDTRAAHENGLVANTSKAMNIVSGKEILEAGDYKVVATKNGTGVPTDAKIFLELVKK